ncbi:MAG: SPFH domain-containing protein, partial [Ruminococcus sp.]|nr:SPFH domain-containing protein [Ruminococcus sp.]
NKRSSNTKGNENIVSNGSKIHVYDNQFMILVDNGKIVDYTAEPGPYTVSMSSTPSLFNGQFGDSLKEAFERVKFAGIPSNQQRVFFINLQEIKNLKFGTPNPIQYFDNFYNAELFIRAHGTYSIKVTDPFKFYQEVIPRSAITQNESVDFTTLNQQYNDEFLSALGAAINQYSADGNRVSYITSKAPIIAKYMADALDQEWNDTRGFQIQSVGLNPPSYDKQSQDLINMRNKGAMLSDAAIQQGYVAGNVSEGLRDAGSNANGAMAGFMGMGIGMNAGGNILGGYMQNPQYSNQNPQQYQQQPQQPQPQVQTQAQPQQAAEQGGWTCECGTVNQGKFCAECGKPKPAAPKKRFCTNCGAELGETTKFCPECGTKA